MKTIKFLIIALIFHIILTGIIIYLLPIPLLIGSFFLIGLFFIAIGTFFKAIL